MTSSPKTPSARTYEELVERIADIRATVAELAGLAAPHAYAVANDLSALGAIKVELQSLLSVVEKLIQAQAVADEITHAIARLGDYGPRRPSSRSL